MTSTQRSEMIKLVSCGLAWSEAAEAIGIPWTQFLEILAHSRAAGKGPDYDFSLQLECAGSEATSRALAALKTESWHNQESFDRYL